MKGWAGTGEEVTAPGERGQRWFHLQERHPVMSGPPSGMVLEVGKEPGIAGRLRIEGEPTAFLFASGGVWQNRLFKHCGYAKTSRLLSPLRLQRFCAPLSAAGWKDLACSPQDCPF